MSAAPTDDMIIMQQEAMRRVQEMQGRARRTIGIEDDEEKVPEHNPPELAPGRRSQREKQDNEVTLITLLLLILMAEDASPELTFALIYLLS